MATAYAALLSLTNNMYLINNHPRHSFHFEQQQMDWLWKIATFLKELMEGNHNYHGARGEALERQIAGAAQAAEDVIESHVADQIRGGKTRGSNTSTRYLLDLEKVIEDLDYVARKATNIYSRVAPIGMEAEQQQQPAYSSTPRTSSSNKTTAKMVGFDDVLIQLLDQLTGVPTSRRVIPIIGMGGIGKTTLVTNAFQHPLIVEHFDVCLWATISQQYRVENIINQLVSHLRKSINQTVDESGSYETVSEELYKSLYGRRYLIVLDDMWSVEAWDAVRIFFPDTYDGSRVVVTSRSTDVARHLDGSWLAMRCLNEDKSWDLFCQTAFEAKQGCPSELEEIGKKIVKKCKGLPLAIVVVGGLFRKSLMTTVEYWENVGQDMNSILDSSQNEEEHCLSVLSLSYSYLPIHLKPCFLHMGELAEDETIVVRDVYNSWIARGVIEPFDNTRLEVVAEFYLWDLIHRNLILVDRVTVDGKVLIIRVHDLIRDVCQNIAQKERFLRNTTPQGTYEGEGSWFSYGTKGRMVVASSISASNFEPLNLRYLNLEVGHSTLHTLHIPSSISLLWNLQTLIIRLPPRSKLIAPYEIWEMLQLRYLVVVNSISLLDPLPTDISSSDQEYNLVLTNLDTLWVVDNFRLSEEVCKRIPNIRDLQLSYCDQAITSYYCPQNLGCFRELQNLQLRFVGDSKWYDFALSLTFPTSLESLVLRGSCGVDWEELMMMVGSLPELTALVLLSYAVIGSTWTLIEGKFQTLKYLQISHSELIHWDADYSHFPVLCFLRLKYLSKLDELPSGIFDIPTLECIELEYCSESATISAMTALMELEDQGNEGLRLDVSFEGDDEALESFNNKVPQELLTSKNLTLHLRNVNPHRGRHHV